MMKTVKKTIDFIVQNIRYAPFLFGVSTLIYAFYIIEEANKEDPLTRNLFGKIVYWNIDPKHDIVLVNIDSYPHSIDLDVIVSEREKYRKNIEIGAFIGKKKNNDTIWLYKKNGEKQIYIHYNHEL